MANPIWITGQGQKQVDLGTVSEGIYFEYPLDSYDPAGGSVTYKFLAGSLPAGISVKPTGFIQGGPYLNSVKNQTTSYSFTVRASDRNGLVSDKSFAMTIANVNPPVIEPTTVSLGEVFDGEFYNLQLTAIELNPNAILTWTLSAGELPNGLTLSSSGLISGFIIPLLTQNSSAPGFNASAYNEFGYDNAQSYQHNTYKFTASVFDGANYANMTYTLGVSAKENFTADTTFTTIDNTYLSIDHDNIYVPIMITPSQTLPEVRSNSKFAFQFQAIDPNYTTINYALGTSSGLAGFDQSGTQGFDEIAFDQENLSVPPGLILDPVTGWFSGTVGSQVQAVQNYAFQVYAFETANPSRKSVPITYDMMVLGDITNTIVWTTNANLGIIDNGTISELSVSAVNKSNRSLTYSLVSDGSRLPQGLELNAEGLLVGRTGFEFFTLDSGTTTIDGAISDFDNVYSFTVQATTTDTTASSQQTFTITIKNVNAIPYEDIYIKALPTLDQRTTFLNIVNNSDIFPDSLLYRASDPNFGRARDIRSLFLAGLKPTEIPTYLSIMNTNTYSKRINFGDVKTAIAVDANFNVKYEVVYIELASDYAFSSTSTATNVYDKVIGQTVYPNSYADMSKVLSNAIGFANIGALPDWMTSPQANKKLLGFTRAIVLAYTVPGASNLIAYRLGENGISFNDINFVVDRYDLDNSYSANYNIATNTYDLGKETTFDRIIRPGLVATSVDYGITNLAFNMINNQTVSHINSLGGLDGITDFSDGDTLIFAQQENYPGETGANDGWMIGSTVIPSWLDFTHSAKYPSTSSGFPVNPSVGQVTLVNGVYYMFVADLDNNGNVVDTVWKIANLRANSWRINIDSNNVVTLTPESFVRFVGSGTSRKQIASMIMIGDNVQINHGNTYDESIVFYNQSIAIGQSVPAFTTVSNLHASPDKNTRFDEYGTRFINNRITYENPEINDKWLIFPNEGPLA